MNTADIERIKERWDDMSEDDRKETTAKIHEEMEAVKTELRRFRKE